ncbi:MAG: hypothetical protein FWE85_01420 [Clostridiales bacterium]|nr:hypothetical protein [Clostridiales bacterium]
MKKVTTNKNKADKTRTKIYVKIFPGKNEVIYSGIDFAEFVKYLPQPIKNLMLITGGSNVILSESRFERGLKLFEGYEFIEKLAKENIYNLGEFCFVDYAMPHQTSELSEEQIAELLYLGHMSKPLHTPFFEALQNDFAYLAHDDGWYCKIYCRNLYDFISVLCKKIMLHASNKKAHEISDDVKERMLQLAMDGILVDLDELSQKDDTVNIYSIGTHLDMDVLVNNCHEIKLRASQVNQLSVSAGEIRAEKGCGY